MWRSRTMDGHPRPPYGLSERASKRSRLSDTQGYSTMPYRMSCQTHRPTLVHIQQGALMPMSVAIVRQRHVVILIPTREPAERDAMPTKNAIIAGTCTIEAYRLRRSQNNVGWVKAIVPKGESSRNESVLGQIQGPGARNTICLSHHRSRCGDNDVSAIIDGFGSVRVEIS